MMLFKILAFVSAISLLAFIPAASTSSEIKKPLKTSDTNIIFCSNDHETDGWKLEISLPQGSRTKAVVTIYDNSGLPTSIRLECSNDSEAHAVGCAGIATATHDKDQKILMNLVLIFRDNSGEGPAITSYTGNYLDDGQWHGGSPETEIVRVNCVLQ